MRIGFLGVPSNLFCSWNFSDGIPATLRRMGHEVLAPSQLGDADLVIVSGPEHQPRLFGTRNIPTVFWYHETCDRIDHDFSRQYSQLVELADLNYFIRKADADRFGGKWLPFAVDETIFNTVGAPPWEDRPHKIAFVGQLYEQRRKFLDEYRKLGGPEIEILQFVGNDAKTPQERAIALADSHRNTQIFVVLPTLIRTTPCKVFEAAACGCCVITPRDDSFADYGMGDIFRYDHIDVSGTADVIRAVMNNQFLAQHFADNGLLWTMQNHRLEQRLQQIIDDVKGLR